MNFMAFGPHILGLFVFCTQFCSACVQTHFCYYRLNRNKTDVLKGDQSALKHKVLHSPLPLPPVDNSQPPKASDDKLSRKKLDPIAVENEVANSSEKKKKKKKKKKKRIVDEAEDNENES